MRPLDRLRSIKTKLGVVIVAAVSVTVVVVVLGSRAGLSLTWRALIAGSLSLAMIHFLARGMTSPLREMASAARAMAKGDYERRVTATSRDEVGELAQAFNRMAAELAEVDRMRRDLVANVSHELRTPISALQAVLENAIDGIEPPDERTLRTMLIQVERLGRLVTQLLDLSRLESGATTLQRQRFRLQGLLEEAVEEARVHSQQGPRAGVALGVKVDPSDIELEADPERLHQVVTNLIHNAVRHSPDGGNVEVEALLRDGRVRIAVSDQGPGISEGETDRVFERFYRSDAARASNDGGTGLGLSIARWIVELHGGDIRARPNHPRGCRMIVELPVVPG